MTGRGGQVQRLVQRGRVLQWLSPQPPFRVMRDQKPLAPGGVEFESVRRS